MIVFDPINKRIILDSTTVSATELYSRSVDWLAESDNSKYGAVFRQVGSDTLGDGLSIPPYFFLQGDWRVRPMEANHSLTITGNLVVDGGGDPVVPTLGQFNVLTKYVVPVQAQGISTSGTSGGLTSEEHNQLMSLAKENTLQRALGLMMENHVEDDIVRDDNDNKVSSKFYLYDSKANALIHNKVTGIISTYTVLITYDQNGVMLLFKVLKD